MHVYDFVAMAVILVWCTCITGTYVIVTLKDFLGLFLIFNTKGNVVRCTRVIVVLSIIRCVCQGVCLHLALSGESIPSNKVDEIKKASEQNYANGSVLPIYFLFFACLCTACTIYVAGNNSTSEITCGSCSTPQCTFS